MKNGLRRAVGQKRAKCCDTVQNASFCKVLQAVLGDEAKCLGVYHHVNKKCRNEENKKKMRGLSYFLLFLLSYFLLSQSWAAVMSDSRTVVTCLTRCSSRVSTKAGGSWYSCLRMSRRSVASLGLLKRVVASFNTLRKAFCCCFVAVDAAQA